MEERNAESTGVSKPAVAAVLLAAVGAAAFLAWRRTAPLSRYAKNRRRDDRGRREPNPQRNPGTAPL